MKLFIFLSIITTVLLSNSDCNKKKTMSNKLKGRLEIKGICYNYTIRLLEGDVDGTLISSEWTDPNTSKSYKNVFGLTEPCTFPDSIKEGGDFYFKIDTAPPTNCIVCNAYYPTPNRSLNIKVIEE